MIVFLYHIKLIRSIEKMTYEFDKVSLFLHLWMI